MSGRHPAARGDCPGHQRVLLRDNLECRAYGSYGTVFKIAPSGTLTTLYSFCAQSACTDGANPVAGLVQATNGDFYGTTENGGAYGYGTVFRITGGGALTTLYSFCAQSGCTDGQNPHAGPVQATNGDLYGTTENGGAYCITKPQILRVARRF